MKKKLGMFFSVFLLLSNVYAQTADIQQGAEKYDWQTCVNLKNDACANDCATSDDINCSENCAAMAKDKCLSEGINPVQ